ncbi:MAG: glycosyltransferase family 4 protein [Thermoplasmatales archaeon]
MKVAFLRPYGVPRWEIAQIKFLNDLGVEAKFISPVIEQSSDESIVDKGYSLRSFHQFNTMLARGKLAGAVDFLFNYRTIEYASLYLNAKSLLKKYDVVHCVDGIFFPVEQALRFAKLPVITFWDNIPFNPILVSKKPTNKLFCEVLKKIKLFFPVSEESAETLRIYGVGEARIKKVHPGIDITYFKRARTKEFSRNINPDNKILILSVGRLTFEKGITFILRALHILKKENLDFKYVHIGSGREYFVNYLKELISKLDLSGVVEFIGKVEYFELPSYYSQATIFVLPSIPMPTWEEQMGFATIEAMACGVVPIVSENSTMREVVPDGCGFRVPAGDFLALANSLRSIILGQVKIHEMADRAVIHVRDNYNALRTATTYLESYTQLIE